MENRRRKSRKRTEKSEPRRNDSNAANTVNTKLDSLSLDVAKPTPSMSPSAGVSSVVDVEQTVGTSPVTDAPTSGISPTTATVSDADSGLAAKLFGVKILSSTKAILAGVIASVSFVSSLVGLILYLDTQVTVVPMDGYELRTPSYMPFILSNPGSFAVNDIKTECKFHNVLRNAEDCGDHVFGPTRLEQLPAHQETTIHCSCFAMISQEQPDARTIQIWPATGSTLEIVVSYRPSYLPFRKQTKVLYNVSGSSDKIQLRPQGYAVAPHTPE